MARDILPSLPPLPTAQEVVFPSTLIFLGHDRNDHIVSVILGKPVRDVLEALGCNMHWRL